ncbi:hypothetical protein [Nocardia cyriacigeorgica]|uniref:hypothetical protein n=1 Tax=Nocardia cyriacigeorgica TaxID=135487 RepID=UPI0011B0E3C6|nr:hypothetical protein [Nocardia cyriacigeorgica]
MGWRSWAAGAVAFGAPILGNVLLPGVGGVIGAAVGGAAADVIERDGFSVSGMGMGALNGMIGGVTGRGISRIGRWAATRSDDAVRAARAGNKAARSQASSVGRRAYDDKYNEQIRLGTNTVDADRLARAAAAAAKSNHLKNNTVKIPDPSNRWARQFHNGTRGKRQANGSRKGAQRTGGASNFLQGVGTAAYYAGNKGPSGNGGGGGGKPPGAQSGGGAGEWVGAHVPSAGQQGTPFVRQENTGPGIVDKPADPWGVLWQPAGLSQGMKALWGGRTAAASATPS